MKNTNKVRESYDWQGMLIVSILMIIGIVLIVSMFIIGAVDIFMFVVSLFFVIIGIYCWLNTIDAKFIKPKKKLLYLYDIKNDKYTFLDQKGNKFIYINEDTINYEEDNYYYVLKTRREIVELLELSNDKFPVPKEKEPFFFTWYSPIGNFKDICLLPIVYVIFIPGILSFIFSNGFDRVYSLFIVLPIGYLIGYDLYYKFIKKDKVDKIHELEISKELKKEQLNNVEESSELKQLEEKSFSNYIAFGYIGALIATIGPIIMFLSPVIKNFKNFGTAEFIFIGFITLIGITITGYFIFNIYVLLKPNKLEIDGNNNLEKIDNYQKKEIKRKKIGTFLNMLPRLIFILFFDGIIIFAIASSYEQLLNDKDSLLGIVIFVVMAIIFNAVVLKDLIKDIFFMKKK